MLFLFINFIVANNFFVLINSSKYFYNYRHGTNIKIFKNLLIENGFTDNEIFLVNDEDFSYDDRNKYKNKIIINEENSEFCFNYFIESTKLNLINLLNIFYLRHEKLYKIDENTNLLIYLCGHGNEDFFKILDRYFLMSNDIEDFINYLSKRVNKLFFIFDTCQANSLINRNNLPFNVSILTTSLEGQSSYSSFYSKKLGINTIDDFIYNFYNLNYKNYKLRICDFFNKNNFGKITSDLTVTSNEMLMSDFFIKSEKKEEVLPFVL